MESRASPLCGIKSDSLAVCWALSRGVRAASDGLDESDLRVIWMGNGQQHRRAKCPWNVSHTKRSSTCLCIGPKVMICWLFCVSFSFDHQFAGHNNPWTPDSDNLIDTIKENQFPPSKELEEVMPEIMSRVERSPLDPMLSELDVVHVIQVSLSSMPPLALSSEHICGHDNKESVSPACP